MKGAWNERLDKRLVADHLAGLSFAEIGERLGVSRCAAIGRYHRLQGKVFPSATPAGRAAAPSKRAAQEWKDKNVLDTMDADIAAGGDRNAAMRTAYLSGCRLSALAAHLGLSKVRVRQLVKI